MSQEMQKTIASEATYQGVGLHTGRKCKITFKPAPANFGIKFIRTDLPGQPVIPALVENVVDVIRGTTIGLDDDVRVYTIEHTLSALFGLEIDNLIIEVDDNEPPVGDGSSYFFVDVIKKAGIKTLDQPKKFYSVSTPVEYQTNQTLIRFEPGQGLEIECEVNYDHPLINNQKMTFRHGDDYSKLVAPARTFCFDFEIEALKKKGLAKGGSLDNAIVVGPSGIYNEGTLRFDNEFVRHKLLDLMGDLMLFGTFLKGKLIAKRCGHGHNIKFLKLLKENSVKIVAAAS
jgi:UDP-3-O-acyl N-acetylglucosamine deacetylase